MGSILVAVDLSESSVTTIDFAAGIASAQGSQLDLIHVFVSAIPARAKVHAPPALREKMTSTEAKEARQAVDQLMLNHVPAAIQGSSMLVEGEPAEVICAKAKEGYKMVVVSTHGRKGLGHVILGSVAERIVRFATIPVLVVR